MSRMNQAAATEKHNLITQWLIKFRDGDSAAGQVVFDLLYEELYRLARRYMNRERVGHTLQPTALLNEAYLELVAQKEQNWRNRTHFIAAAAQAMRRILIDYARTKMARKRGGDAIRVEADEKMGVVMQRPEEYLALDEALNRLSAHDPELTKIVEMRYFGGLTEEEIAEALGHSTRTIKRRWRVAKAWLGAELKGG